MSDTLLTCGGKDVDRAEPATGLFNVNKKGQEELRNVADGRALQRQRKTWKIKTKSRCNPSIAQAGILPTTGPMQDLPFRLSTLATRPADYYYGVRRTERYEKRDVSPPVMQTDRASVPQAICQVPARSRSVAAQPGRRNTTSVQRIVSGDLGRRLDSELRGEKKHASCCFPLHRAEARRQPKATDGRRRRHMVSQYRSPAVLDGLVSVRFSTR